MSKTALTNDIKPVTNADWEKLLGRVVALPDDRVRDLYDAINEVLDGKPTTNARATFKAHEGFKLPKGD